MFLTPLKPEYVLFGLNWLFFNVDGLLQFALNLLETSVFSIPVPKVPDHFLVRGASSMGVSSFRGPEMAGS